MFLWRAVSYHTAWRL